MELNKKVAAAISTAVTAYIEQEKAAALQPARPVRSSRHPCMGPVGQAGTHAPIARCGNCAWSRDNFPFRGFRLSPGFIRRKDNHGIP